MKKEDFVEKTLEFWVKTAIPMSAANLQIYTKVGRRKMRGWLEEMVDDGVLSLDSDLEGNLVYKVPGASRPAAPRSFAQLEARSGGSRSSESLALTSLNPKEELVRRAKADLRNHDDEKKKSLLVSAGLSLFGPLGWFYAGSLKEATLGTAAFIGVSAIASVLPSFMTAPFLAPVAIASAGVGLIYAWRYNRKGKRVRLFEDKDKKKKLR